MKTKIYTILFAMTTTCLCLTTTGIAGAISLEVNYLSTSTETLDLFSLTLVSQNDDVNVCAWDGDFYGTFYQAWTPIGTTALPTTMGGDALDTHYYSGNSLFAINEDNDLSIDGQYRGWGTSLTNAVMTTGNTNSYPLAQIAIQAGTSFSLIGTAADGIGNKYNFDVSLSKGDGGLQTIASELYIPPPAAPTTPTEPTEPIISEPVPQPTPAPDDDGDGDDDIDDESINQDFIRDMNNYVLWPGILGTSNIVPLRTPLYRYPTVFYCPSWEGVERFDLSNLYDRYFTWDRFAFEPKYNLLSRELIPYSFPSDDPTYSSAASIIPEPLSLSLLLIGGLGLLSKRRK